MKTKEQRKQAFLKDFQRLLQKHGAEIEITDDGKEYGMHNGICIISMMSVYKDNKLVKDFCEFNL